MKHSPAIDKLIQTFLVLPGIGRRTAERFAFSLLEGDPRAADNLASALVDARAAVKTCTRCGQFSEESLCLICKDARREQDQLCIVADSRTIPVMEQTNAYQGLYFVLGGLINPTEGSGPERLRFTALKARLDQRSLSEIILALDPTTQGDATALYIRDILKSYPTIKLSRLGRGLPTGARLEYADELTLADALSGRKTIDN